jgi:hypothetical protein
MLTASSFALPINQKIPKTDGYLPKPKETKK